MDYVTYKNGKAYLYVNEKEYSTGRSEVRSGYGLSECVHKAYNFTVKLNKLPNVNGIDSSDGKTIDDLEKEYNDMTDYRKSLPGKRYREQLE